MLQPNNVLFYVDDIPASSAFYADLLGRQPAIASPFFAMFKLDNGFEVAIYSRAKIEPPAPDKGSSSELGFTVPDVAALHELYQQWVKKGIRIIMEPKKMYFGGTHFMAEDPNGHRLRVGTPD
jgi:uncharacterized glyoxalase superfamily protein PhnB